MILSPVSNISAVCARWQVRIRLNQTNLCLLSGLMLHFCFQILAFLYLTPFSAPTTLFPFFLLTTHQYSHHLLPPFSHHPLFSPSLPSISQTELSMELRLRLPPSERYPDPTLSRRAFSVLSSSALPPAAAFSPYMALITLSSKSTSIIRASILVKARDIL